MRSAAQEAGALPGVCEEAPVEIVYNGRKAVTLMCTPLELKQLALGWLFSQGLISGTGEVYALAACDDMRKIYVQTAVDHWEERQGWDKILTSGCGGGTILTEQIAGEVPKVTGNLRFSLPGLARLLRDMSDSSALYRLTGGVHSAALGGGGRLLAQSEDLGRHNAVDKVIGKGLLLGLDFSQTALLTTGRVSCEMVLKAAKAGVPVIASLTIPTSLAVELATRAGITLVGRAGSRRATVFTHRERLVLEQEHRIGEQRWEVVAEG